MTVKNTTFRQKIIAVSSAIILSAAVAAPCLIATDNALAAEETRVYTWKSGESQPAIPQTIDVNGKTYKLKSTGQAKQADSSSTLSQTFNKTVEATYSGDYSGIPSSVPESVSVNQDGYSGNIPRTKIDYQTVNRNETKTDSTTQSRTVTSKDENLVPQSWTKNGHLLQRENVEFKETSWDSDGNPIMWLATATYSGSWQESVFDHYNVTAYYSGTLTKTANNGDWSISAVYENTDGAAGGITNGNTTTGSTSTFADVDASNYNSAANKNANRNSNMTNVNTNEAIDASANQNKNSNANANKNYNIATKEVENPNNNQNGGIFSNLPIIPIAAVVGVLLVGGLVFMFLKKRKEEQIPPLPADETYKMDNGAATVGGIMDLEAAAAEEALAQKPAKEKKSIFGKKNKDKGQEQAPASAEQGATPKRESFLAGLFKKKNKNATQEELAQVAAAGAIAPVQVEAELIEYFDDGTGDNQRVLAILDIMPSTQLSAPTKVYIPAPPSEFVPANGADYYVAISTTEGFASSMLQIFASDKQIYAGSIDTQIKLDTVSLANGLNNAKNSDDILDLTSEFATYSKNTDYGQNASEELKQAAFVVEEEEAVPEEDASYVSDVNINEFVSIKQEEKEAEVEYDENEYSAAGIVDDEELEKEKQQKQESTSIFTVPDDDDDDDDFEFDEDWSLDLDDEFADAFEKE